MKKIDPLITFLTILAFFKAYSLTSNNKITAVGKIIVF